MEIAINIPKERINGNQVTLSVTDIINITKDYQISCIREFIKENHSDWSKDKLDFVTKRAFEIFDNIERGEDERLAIDEAEDEWKSRIRKEVR
jgi:hypothetical protein